MNKQGYVYILVSKPYGTLYVGVTSALIKRIYQHKNNLVDGFSKKYSTHDLVYFGKHQGISEAIVREKQIKHWNRDWKINLIEKDNPHWQDLYSSIL